MVSLIKILTIITYFALATTHNIPPSRVLELSDNFKGDQQFIYNGDRTRDEIVQFAHKLSESPMEKVTKTASSTNFTDHYIVADRNKKNGTLYEQIDAERFPTIRRVTRGIQEDQYQNCINCTSSANCWDCKNMTSCTYCRGCTNCTSCTNCTGCTNCTNCHNCHNCVNCTNCTNCSNLTNSPSSKC